MPPPDAITKTETTPGDSSSTGAFLCVCGELIRVTSSPNLKCAHCERVYSHDAVQRYGAETRTLEARGGFNPPSHLTPREPGGPPVPDRTSDVLPAGSRLGRHRVTPWGNVGQGELVMTGHRGGRDLQVVEARRVFSVLTAKPLLLLLHEGHGIKGIRPAALEHIAAVTRHGDGGDDAHDHDCYQQFDQGEPALS